MTDRQPDEQLPASNQPPQAATPAPRSGRRPPAIVRYGAMNWIGEFACKPRQELTRGARVVIETDRGIELGELIGPASDEVLSREDFQDRVRAYTDNSGNEFCRPRAGRLLRTATTQDLDEQRHLDAHAPEDINYCAQLATEFGLDMKIITAEYLLGGERIVFYFGAPARVDFRQLVRQLAQRYRTRIEMRQVGARDEARLVADYEVCGRECCCRNFLKKLRPVNMKMAKLQKSTLDPSKVSGRCGRLRCCLRYEHLGYEELADRLPRSGRRVETEFGAGTVIDQQVLTQLVTVRTDAERIVVVPLEEIKAFDVPFPTKEEQPPARQAAPETETDESASSPRRRSRRSRGRRGRGEGDQRNQREDTPTTGDATQPPDAGQRPASTSASDGGGEEGGKKRRRRKRKPRRRPPDQAASNDSN